MIQTIEYIEKNETLSLFCYYFLSNWAKNFALSHSISVIKSFAYKRSFLLRKCLESAYSRPTLVYVPIKVHRHNSSTVDHRQRTK